MPGKSAQGYEIRDTPGAKKVFREKGRPGQVGSLEEGRAIVPETFGALGPAIKQTYEELVKSGEVKPVPELSEAEQPKLPRTVEQGMKDGDIWSLP